MTGNGFEVPEDSRYAGRDWTIQENYRNGQPNG